MCPISGALQHPINPSQMQCITVWETSTFAFEDWGPQDLSTGGEITFGIHNTFGGDLFIPPKNMQFLAGIEKDVSRLCVYIYIYMQNTHIHIYIHSIHVYVYTVYYFVYIMYIYIYMNT
jgi:hypothetical protein